MISFDKKEMERAQALLKRIPNGTVKAASAAINKTVNGVRTDITREITKEYYVKSGVVRKTMTLQRSKPSTLSAIIESQGARMPLKKFKVLPGKVQHKGRHNRKIRAAVKKGGGKTLNNAFVAQMRTGHVGVYVRRTNKRLPLKELYGPAIPQMIRSGDTSKIIEEKARKRLSKNLDHEISRIRGGIGK